MTAFRDGTNGLPGAPELEGIQRTVAVAVDCGTEERGPGSGFGLMRVALRVAVMAIRCGGREAGAGGIPGPARGHA
jgi:hypothetical protein